MQKVRTEKDHGICILLPFRKICQWKIAPTHMRPIFVKKKPRLSLFVKKKKFKFTENEIFEIFMKGNWKSMSGSISIQSCSSNIISKSHNLARKTRGESFSIFCCSCCLRLAYQACLPQHRLEYPHKRNWILALYKVCNIAPCQISNRKTNH